MADAAPDPTDLEPIYRQLLQQTLAPQAVAQPASQQPSPSSHEGRGWLSLLGEALGGGEQYGSTAEREAGGLRALQSLGMNMLAGSDYSYRPHTLGSIIAGGMGAAQQSLGQTQAVSASQAAAAQDYAEKQQQMQLARVKEAVPLLTSLQTMQQLAQARRIALGATPGTTPGTSIGAVGGADLTGDKAHDLPLIAQRESGGDPTALNYVAKADPSAYDRGATASGKYQIVNSTWREGMQLAGLDPAKYATARDAPESVQDQVASALYDKHGNTPWQKGTKDWVKDESGRYQLATVRPAAGAPGGPKPVPATTAAAAPPAVSTAPPGVTMGDAAHPELAPGPPGSTGGAPIGVGAALGGGGTTALPEPPIPPPAVAGTPLPAGKLQSTGRPPGVAGDVAAMQEGRRLAQTEQLPSVLAAGPAAGPSAAPGGFGGSVGSYGATTTPPPVVAPQPTAQAPLPPPSQATTSTPPAVTAPPSGGMPEPAPYVYPRQPLPPDIQQRIAQPLSPEQLAPYDRAIQSATTVEAIQKAQADKNAAITTARAEVAKEGEAWQQNERNKGQEIWQKRWDAWNTNEQQRQQAAQKLENDLRLKAAEGEQTRITNKEAVFNQANQKGLETAQTEQANARDVVAQLEGFRNISDNVGQPGWLQTTKFPGTDQSIAERLQQAGVVKLDDTAGVQLLRGGITNLVKTLRAGMPMGSLSDRDLSFVERMGPTEWMDPDTRSAAVGYLQQAYKAKMNFARDVQKEMSRGKNYGDAMDAADTKQKPFVPQVPADLTTHWSDNTPEWKDRRTQWAEQNDVRPGTLIHMGDGRIVVIKTPKRAD
jgi:hypothetical protein